MFRSSHGFWSFLMRSYKIMKMLCNLCLHFARQDGQNRKKTKENHATKMTKIPKTKRQKYGMNETIDQLEDYFTFKRFEETSLINCG